MLEAEPEKRQVIVRESQVVDDLLGITAHYKTDPVLLAAVCSFARQLFSRPEVTCDQAFVADKLQKKMQNLVQLVPYLGLKKYEEVIKMARRYHQSSSDFGATSGSLFQEKSGMV